jgi:alanine racemase
MNSVKYPKIRLGMSSQEKKLLRPVWVEIDLDALRNNFQETRRLVGNDVKIISSLKCDAYGFGYLEVAEEVISMGAYGIAVADLFEAVNLRRRGIEVPILLYANNLASTADTVIEHNLIPTVTEFESAKMYSREATFPMSIFVKVDVGLNRVGVSAEHAVSFVEKLVTLRNIIIGGIYTHFHFSENAAYIDWQFNKFKAVIDALEVKEIEVPIKMASSTPAILQFPYTYLNAVDPGRLIFGNPVVPEPKQRVLLKPVFRSLKARIIERKRVNPRTEFKDNAPFLVQRDMVIGIIPIGWGDGYSRAHSSIGPALVCGKRVSVLNGINFEHTRIDLTDVPEARIGDEVVLIGKQGNEEITLEEVVNIRATDMHEVCQSVRSHIPRIYFKDSKPYKSKTPMGETLL